jgi:hypothetical protein
MQFRSGGKRDDKLVRDVERPAVKLRVYGCGVDDFEPAQITVEAEAKILQKLLAPIAALHVELLRPNGAAPLP